MDPDQKLLQSYLEQRSQRAFAELVARHVNLVYGVALRRLNGHSALAEDVTQQVFTDLARKAESLSRHGALAAWLYRSTRFAASQAARGEHRRRLREEQAMALSHGDAATPEQGDLQNLHVHIDDALDGLAEEDRQAIVLRYYGSKSFVEIGQMFGLSDDGARKRVDRALDKLRTVMLRKGVTSTAVALSAALTVNAATTAPVALGASVAGTAVASATAAGVGAMLAT